jgi:hypothetical protein
MIEQYLIYLIKDKKLENLCLESSENKQKWYFSCYIGKAYKPTSQEVWVEGDSPFKVLEEALKFISRYERGLKVGDRKTSKWDDTSKLVGIDLQKNE